MDEIVGYKWLAQYPDGTLVSPVAAANRYVPLGQATWVNGHLEAHESLTATNTIAFISGSLTPYSPGIHAHKTMKEACLLGNSNLVRPLGTNMILVKVLLSGTVIEGEKGYWAQYADIMEIVPLMVEEEKTINEYEWQLGLTYSSWASAVKSMSVINGTVGQLNLNMRDAFSNKIMRDFYSGFKLNMGPAYSMGINYGPYPDPISSNTLFTDGIQRIHQIYLDIKEEENG